MSLPGSNGVGVAALLLPILTGMGPLGVQLFTRSRNRMTPKLNSTLIIVALYIFLIIYDTAIASLALTRMAPLDVLHCQLRNRWESWWRLKDASTIRRIQDRHNCCGFNSLQDMAWPFPNRDRSTNACHATFGRDESCFEPWLRDMRVAAGLMLLVAVVAFLVQMALLLTNREFNFLHHNAIIGHGSIEGDAENDEENDRADTGPKRRLEYNYSDEPRTNQQIEDSRTSEQTDDRRHHSGPIVQPSTLRGEGNEWTDT